MFESCPANTGPVMAVEMYVTLGSRGPRVSRVGLGFWQLGSRLWGARQPDREALLAGLTSALEGGINLLDTAEVYGGGLSERLLGESLRKLDAKSEFVVVSKVAGYRASSDDILEGAKGIVGRLGFAPDVILHHWPPPIYSNLCNVVRGLEKVVVDGMASYYGLSNYGEDQITRALECARRLEPIVDQVQYSLAYRPAENKLIPMLAERGIGVMAWSPLAKGALAGVKRPQTKAQRGDRVFKAASNDRELQKALEEVASRHGVTKAIVALAWVAAKGAVPIVGWRRPARIADAVRAASLALTGEDLALLDAASSKYLKVWGDSYKPEPISRVIYVPGILQRIFITLQGGI